MKTAKTKTKRPAPGSLRVERAEKKRAANARLKRAAKRHSTALAKIAPAVIAAPAIDAQLVTTPGFDGRVVDSGFRLDALGLMELKATPEEEKVLARDPELVDVAVLPTGVPYLPHQVYTRWLNEAFGRGGWTLVPVGKPALIEKTVTCPYILYVHGRPVAHANGEQQFHESNRDQSYGDALESTYASALRRCCKHLGVALVLWDRRWWMHNRSKIAIQVQVEVNRKQGDQWKKTIVDQWRRADDPPLKGEVAKGRAPREDKPENREEHADMDKPISEQKRERLWRIASRVGRNEADIKRWLLDCYKVKSSAEITNRHYDKIVRTLEGSGPLPECPPVDKREPGQEG